eukprot:206270-Rhodomonas_salina.1
MTLNLKDRETESTRPTGAAQKLHLQGERIPAPTAAGQAAPPPPSNLNAKHGPEPVAAPITLSCKPPAQKPKPQLQQPALGARPSSSPPQPNRRKALAAHAHAGPSTPPSLPRRSSLASADPRLGERASEAVPAASHAPPKVLPPTRLLSNRDRRDDPSPRLPGQVVHVEVEIRDRELH